MRLLVVSLLPLLALTACSSPAPATTHRPSAGVTSPTVPAKLADAALEERCDDLAAARFTSRHDTDPVFVDPLFGPGAHGTTIVQQHVPFTDPSGQPQTALLECSGTFHDADNTVTAELTLLATEK